ncbi:Uncharacterised protein [Raoultella planticola]|uniref:Uncharacterized protein n=1 Tax=Raoultella planticola TaxID=575 RepID=A0A485C5B7_RAOPL|nr:Uncharacterised protein [Raoultella planticola]
MRVMPGMMNNMCRCGDVARKGRNFASRSPQKIVKRVAPGAELRTQVGLYGEGSRLQHRGQTGTAVVAAQRNKRFPLLRT